MNRKGLGSFSIAALLSILTLSAANPPEAPDPAAFDSILKRYVLEDGTVKYAELRENLDPLTRFVEQIALVSPDSHPSLFPSSAHKLAYWLNTYNALVLWVVAKEYPEKKEQRLTEAGRAEFFTKLKFDVGGQARSLDDIETNALRKQFREPRIHFAIVCAARSCPWMSRDAFTPAMLEPQLEGRTKLFLSQERNFRLDTGTREVTISAIFDWFKEDFGSSKEALLGFIGRQRPEALQAWGQKKWKLRFFSYDWAINEAE